MGRLAGLVALAIVLGVAPAHAWRTAVTGTPPDGRPTAIAVDVDDTIVAVGRTPNLAGKEDAIAVALGGAYGVELWQHRVAGGAAQDDLYRRSRRATASWSRRRPRLEPEARRRRADHALRARRVGDVGGADRQRVHLDDDAFAVTIDADGDVVVAGQTESTTPEALTAAVHRVEALGETGPSSGRATSRPRSSVPRARRDGRQRRIAAGTIGLTMTIAASTAHGRGCSGRGSTPARRLEQQRRRQRRGGRGRPRHRGRPARRSAGDPDFAVMAFDVVTGAELWRIIIDGTTPARTSTKRPSARRRRGRQRDRGRPDLEHAAGDDAIAVKLAGPRPAPSSGARS